jgi:hypothetical protein
MGGSSPQKWAVDLSQYKAWLRNQPHQVINELRLQEPTARSLVLLSLLDSIGTELTYQEINNHLSLKKVVRPSLPLTSLRVAASDIALGMDIVNSNFTLQIRKVGKEARLSLIARENLVAADSLIPVRANPVNEVKQIATDLVRDGGGLPFSALYGSYRAAASWIVFSTITSVAKKEYEGGHIHSRLSKAVFQEACESQRLTVIGSACGEGLGEIELLEKLLIELPPTVQVDYVAIDSSDLLLLCHTKLVQNRYSDEIRNHRIRFTPILGNVFYLPQLLKNIREQTNTDIAASGPVVCTYFGNCLGNYEYFEWEFFKNTAEAIERNRSLTFLIGVSVQRVNKANLPIQENYTLDSFLLETPRHLLYDLGLLESLDEKGEQISDSKNKEFLQDKSSTKKIPMASYVHPFGITGTVYRFYYQLKNTLRTRDGHHTLRKGNYLLLYSIIKYDLGSLVRFLESREYKVNAPSKNEDYLVIEEGEEVFKYAIIAATRSKHISH